MHLLKGLHDVPLLHHRRLTPRALHADAPPEVRVADAEVPVTDGLVIHQTPDERLAVRQLDSLQTETVATS